MKYREAKPQFCLAGDSPACSRSTRLASARTKEPFTKQEVTGRERLTWSRPDEPMKPPDRTAVPHLYVRSIHPAQAKGQALLHHTAKIETRVPRAGYVCKRANSHDVLSRECPRRARTHGRPPKPNSSPWLIDIGCARPDLSTLEDLNPKWVRMILDDWQGILAHKLYGIRIKPGSPDLQPQSLSHLKITLPR
jgi:hypothetical protein